MVRVGVTQACPAPRPPRVGASQALLFVVFEGCVRPGHSLPGTRMEAS